MIMLVVRVELLGVVVEPIVESLEDDFILVL
jgi:hypothetical protein